MRIGNVSAGRGRTSGRTFGRSLGRQVQRRWVARRSIFRVIAKPLKLSTNCWRSRSALVLNSFITIMRRQLKAILQHHHIKIIYYLLLTVFIHARKHTFSKSASSTLIPVCFVNWACAFRFRFANVLSVTPNRSLRKNNENNRINTILLLCFIGVIYFCII